MYLKNSAGYSTPQSLTLQCMRKTNWFGYIHTHTRTNEQKREEFTKKTSPSYLYLYWHCFLASYLLHSIYSLLLLFLPLTLSPNIYTICVYYVLISRTSFIKATANEVNVYCVVCKFLAFGCKCQYMFHIALFNFVYSKCPIVSHRKFFSIALIKNIHTN